MKVMNLFPLGKYIGFLLELLELQKQKESNSTSKILKISNAKLVIQDSKMILQAYGNACFFGIFFFFFFFPVLFYLFLVLKQQKGRR